MNFFDDILIPAESLQHPARFDETEQLWVWQYAGDDEESHDLFMDIGEEIRFRVIEESFTDTSPTGPEGWLNVLASACVSLSTEPLVELARAVSAVHCQILSVSMVPLFYRNV